MSMCSLLLCCWKRVFAMTSTFSWQNSVSLWPASFCIPRPNMPVTPGVSLLPTFAFQSPIMGVISKRSCGFPHFLQFKSEFGNKELIIWATVSSRSCFCSLYRASASLAANNIINLISVLTIWWCPCVESSLVLLEEGVCYDQCIFSAKLY